MAILEPKSTGHMYMYVCVYMPDMMCALVCVPSYIVEGSNLICGLLNYVNSHCLLNKTIKTPSNNDRLVPVTCTCRVE